MPNAQNTRPQVISLTHDQEPIQITTPKEVKKSSNKKRFVISFLISILLVGGGYLFFWPRAQTVMFASRAIESVTDLFIEID